MEDPGKQNPSWRLHRLEVAEPFGCWHEIDRSKLLWIRKKLSDFESMTWNEILVYGRDQNHPVRVDKLLPGARKRLTELRLEDIDQLVSLRLSGSERIYGILQGSILLLLWWDPDHAIYPVKKKHT